MGFTTHIFVFYFLPLFLLVYFSLPRQWRNLWITLARFASGVGIFILGFATEGWQIVPLPPD